MNKNIKNILVTVVVSAVTAMVSVFGYAKFYGNRTGGIQDLGKIPVNYAGFFGSDENKQPLVDFSTAANAATPAVVHIRTKTKAKQVKGNIHQKRVNPFGDMFGDEFFDDFFGGGPKTIPEQQASGSGVIITNDGYIITNNHVVKDADEISVTLTDKKSYKATVIGTDASTDLAVIKIDATNLPYLIYGNSDNVKLGQWVLAVGYPLNLEVTVTAGIISAKNRNININEGTDKISPIESFLQTDAAVNKGNSGGALVNTNGELVGINSAIASPTGSYAGYSYAIPVNLVKKVVTDIVKFGIVQRAYLGVEYLANAEYDEAESKKIKDEFGVNAKDIDGVLIRNVVANGAAKEAGIKKGDIVTKIDNVVIKTGPELQEIIGRHKPGDKVNITYKRDNKEYSVVVTLKNSLGNDKIVKNVDIMDKLGAEFEAINKKVALENNVAGGILLKKKGKGLIQKSKIQEGFVITYINEEEVTTMDEFKDLLKKYQNEKAVYVLGFYIGDEYTYKQVLYLRDDEDGK